MKSFGLAQQGDQENGNKAGYAHLNGKWALIIIKPKH